jgi:hydroxypyruvate reductase
VRLAAACRATTFTFALSDVVTPVDDDASVIGSGPTVADPSTYEDALSIINRLGVAESLPMAARALLERGTRGEIEETPKPDDPRLSGGAYVIAGSRKTAMSAARLEAERRNYHGHVQEAAVTGEARVAGPEMVARALAHARPGQPSCLIASGETVVRVTGAGKGGRNQELALSALAGVTDAPRAMFLASVASDGVDGPTDAAGAWVGPETTERAKAAGLDAARAVRANDSYNFFNPLGALIRTGPTGTNVGDLQIVIVA